MCVNRTLNPDKDRKRKTEKLEMPETPEKKSKKTRNNWFFLTKMK
jgi:hypothetical protein